MSWNPTPGQDPNQPNPSQYGGYTPQPNPGQYGTPPSDPYSGQQGAYQQPGSGYGQPQYGQPQYGYQQPYSGAGAAAGTLGPTSTGMDANVAAGLSYVLGWITGLIFFLIEKQNRFVRFHAMQSLIFFGAITIIDIAFNFMSNLFGAFALVGCFVIPIVSLIAFVGWIVLMINAFQGKYFKLPLIGDYAERYANPPM
jgi:uncharacterized membrane protein